MWSPNYNILCFNACKCVIKVKCFLDMLYLMSWNCSRLCRNQKCHLFKKKRSWEITQQLVSNWEGTGQVRLCHLCICCVECGLAPVWPSVFLGGCDWLVVSNPMKWKIVNKGFKLLLSLPQLFGCCPGDRIYSCSTQIHKITVISQSRRSWGDYTMIWNHITNRNCPNVAAVLL